MAAQPARRYTYCSVKTPNPRILSFSEDSIAASQQGEISTFSMGVKSESRIVHLDTVPTLGETQDVLLRRSLLAVHESGEVNCYSENLEKLEWSAAVRGGSKDQDGAVPVRVEHAVVTTVEQVRKSILKNREDVLATRNAGQKQTHGSLLLLVTSIDASGKRENALPQMQVFSIEAQNTELSGLVQKSRSQLQRLTSFSIPQPAETRCEKTRFSFHVDSGTLYQQTTDTVLVYDLNGSVPRLAHQARLGLEHISSCLRLSPTLVAITSTASVSIMSLPYCSLQAQVNLDAKSWRCGTAWNSNSGSTQHAAPQLLSYFRPLGLIVALNGRRLVAIQTSSISSGKGVSRKRNRGGLLVDSLGRGMSIDQRLPQRESSKNAIQDFGTYLPSSNVDAEWTHQRSTLDSFLSKGDINGFSDFLAPLVGIGVAETPQVDQRKISYLLNKLFKMQSDTERGDHEIAVAFWPAKICAWLMQKGLFTLDRVESALKHYQFLLLTSKLAQDSIISALGSWDPTLQVLASLLSSPAVIRPQELVHVLLTLTNSSQDPLDGAPNLLTNGPDHTSSISIQSPPQGPSPPPKPSEEIRTLILHLALTRLHPTPSKHLTQALQPLPPASLLQLVDLLRLALANAGWLSPYTSAPLTPPSTPPHSNPNSQIQQISHILTSVLDALGPTGWLLGSSAITSRSTGTDGSISANTINHMKAEISAALEGIEEATYLRGLLGEMLVCGKGALLPSASMSSNSKSQSQKREGAGGAIKPMSVPLEAESAFLPLGLKRAKAVPLTKVGAGGEVIRRSRRDIGRLKSRQVGKYSFERIVV